MKACGASISRLQIPKKRLVLWCIEVEYVSSRVLTIYNYSCHSGCCDNGLCNSSVYLLSVLKITQLHGIVSSTPGDSRLQC